MRRAAAVGRRTRARLAPAREVRPVAIVVVSTARARRREADWMRRVAVAVQTVEQRSVMGTPRRTRDAALAAGGVASSALSGASTGGGQAGDGSGAGPGAGAGAGLTT